MEENKRRKEALSTEIEFMCCEEEEVGLRGKEWVEGVALRGGGGQGRLRQSIKL